MNISFVIKSLVLSLTVFFIMYAIAFVSSQNIILDANNYGVRSSVKESINIAQYRLNGDIKFDEDALIENVIKNYVNNNNISVDDVMFEIAVDEVNNIVTVKITTEKEVLDVNSESSSTFSYQIVER